MISWHVGDTKISHVNSNVVSSVIQEIEKKLGKMSVTRYRQVCFSWYGHHF